MREVLIADRGQGIFATIKRARPKIKNDVESIRIAFTERISGRAPEQRGNGLKFVKKIIEDQRWNLALNSGKGSCHIENGITSFINTDNNTNETIVLIKF